MVIDAVSQEQPAQALKEPEVTVQSFKQTFQLGEIVPLEITLKNSSGKLIEITESPCFEIALENGDFKVYAGPGKSYVIDGVSTSLTIQAGKSLTIQQTILWNLNPDVAHLNVEAAKPILQDRILSDYAFPEVGRYRIKACTGVLMNGKWEMVESEPISVRFTKPTGEDAYVWDKMKDRGDIAYFLQEGDLLIPTYRAKDRDKLLKEIEQLMEQYPNSIYAESIRESMKKFQAIDARRKESAERLKPNN